VPSGIRFQSAFVSLFQLCMEYFNHVIIKDTSFGCSAANVQLFLETLISVILDWLWPVHKLRFFAPFES